MRKIDDYDFQFHQSKTYKIVDELHHRLRRSALLVLQVNVLVSTRNFCCMKESKDVGTCFQI